MSVNASLTQLVLLSAGHVWGPTRRGWGSWAGRDKMRPLDRRNSSVPGRIPACAQWEERRRNQDVNTPQTIALWPSRASCRLGLGTGLAAAPKMRFALQIVHLSCLPGCSAEPELLATFLTNPSSKGQWRGKVTNNSRARRRNEMSTPLQWFVALTPPFLTTKPLPIGATPGPLCPKGLCWKGPLKVCSHTRPGLCFWIYHPRVF